MKYEKKWQESIVLTMDSFFVGTGWHKIQKEDQDYFRWTGPDAVSSMHLFPRRDQSNRLNITVRHSLSEDVLKGLRLEADGLPLQVTLGKQRSPAYITAVLPENSAVREGDKTVLTIHVPETIVPAEQNPKAKDKRRLGLCIQEVNFLPLKRAMFTAQKFNEPRPFDGLFFIKNNPGVRDAVIHGLYKSAYEYFCKHKGDHNEDAFELHPHFDECPGDLFDIMQSKMDDQYQTIIKKQQEEISLLREVVYHQSDDLQNLRKQIKEIL